MGAPYYVFLSLARQTLTSAGKRPDEEWWGDEKGKLWEHLIMFNVLKVS
jgi:hypothetical protein